MDDQRTDRTDGRGVDFSAPETKRDLASVAMIVPGVAMIALVIGGVVDLGWFAAILWIVGGTAISAGVFNLFKMAAIGALIGLCLQIAFIIWLVNHLRGVSFE
jgi:hypothetical protein